LGSMLIALENLTGFGFAMAGVYSSFILRGPISSSLFSTASDTELMALALTVTRIMRKPSFHRQLRDSFTLSYSTRLSHSHS
jgi:hypothetical protein